MFREFLARRPYGWDHVSFGGEAVIFASDDDRCIGIPVLEVTGTLNRLPRGYPSETHSFNELGTGGPADDRPFLEGKLSRRDFDLHTSCRSLRIRLRRQEEEGRIFAESGQK